VNKAEEFKKYVKKIQYYYQALSLIRWDIETGAPKKCIESRAQAIGEISTYAFEMSTSEKMENFLNELSLPESMEKLSDNDRALVRVMKKDFEKQKKIPPELVGQLSVASSKAQAAWEKAKINDDFSIFQPFLQEVVLLTKKMADCLGYEANRYDALLDEYEPGFKSNDVKKVISYLKKELVPFVEKITEKEVDDDYSFLKMKVDRQVQRKLSEKVLRLMNYDHDAGRLDVSMHPFTTSIGANDIRITTFYRDNDFSDSFFSTVHECGHALYEQGVSSELADTPLSSGASMAMHESQSRLWENIVARSHEFWEFFYPETVKIIPELSSIDMERFYRGINTVKRSLIRTQADEVTYNLHIMMRFEIEEALINDRIKVSELEQIWNSKMEEYLGIVPLKASEGILQDVHWSHGSFGYFPSYMLGNVYSVQIYNQMKKDIPSLKDSISNGDLKVILDWLREKIHVHGKKYEPKELLAMITGQEPDPSYFMEYIKEKYSHIYKI